MGRRSLSPSPAITLAAETLGWQLQSSILAGGAVDLSTVGAKTIDGRAVLVANATNIISAARDGTGIAVSVGATTGDWWMRGKWGDWLPGGHSRRDTLRLVAVLSAAPSFAASGTGAEIDIYAKRNAAATLVLSTHNARPVATDGRRVQAFAGGVQTSSTLTAGTKAVMALQLAYEQMECRYGDTWVDMTSWAALTAEGVVTNAERLEADGAPATAWIPATDEWGIRVIAGASLGLASTFQRLEFWRLTE